MADIVSKIIWLFAFDTGFYRLFHPQNQIVSLVRDFALN